MRPRRIPSTALWISQESSSLSAAMHGMHRSAPHLLSAYSPKCVEVEFSEVRGYKLPRPAHIPIGTG